MEPMELQITIDVDTETQKAKAELREYTSDRIFKQRLQDKVQDVIKTARKVG